MITRKAKSEEKDLILNLYDSVKGRKYCSWDENYPTGTDVDNDLNAGCLYLFEDEGKVIGGVSVIPENELDSFSCWSVRENAGEFGRVFIIPDYQGKRLSRVMISDILKLFRQSGKQTAHILVVRTNIPALRLYSSLGFEIRGETELYGKSFYLCEKVLRSETIETERLVIHAASREEMEAFTDSQTDEILKAAYGEMLDCAVSNPALWEFYAMWMMELKDGTHVGGLCFMGLSEEGVTEIGYGVSEEYRGKGYATEAVKALAGWALGQSRVVRIEAEAEEDNAASINVLTKCGFLPTGLIGEEGPRFALTE